MTWLEGWSKRIKLTVDGTKVEDNLADFPLLVVLSSGTGINNADVTDIFDELYSVLGSKKIMITTSVDAPCYTEIESWDWENKLAYLWIKAPTLSSGVDTELYFYYSKEQPDNTTYVGLTGAEVSQNVWDSNYTGVWHFNTTPVVGSNTVLDSTVQLNNGSPGSAVSVVESDYGKAYDFSNSINSYVFIDDDASIDFSNAMTLMVFYTIDSLLGGSFPVVTKDVQSGNDYAYGIYCNPPTATFSWAEDAGPWGPTWIVNDSTAPLTGQWRLNTMVFNGDVVKHYHNGFYSASSSSTVGTIRNNAAALRFGYSNTWGGNIFDGKITEARVSNVVRGAGWIKSTYYTIVNDLLTFGAIENETRWYFSGYVKELTTPVSRQIYVYRRDTGELVGSTTSSGDGHYYLETTYSGAQFIVALDDESGSSYNMARLDKMIPATI